MSESAVAISLAYHVTGDLCHVPCEILGGELHPLRRSGGNGRSSHHLLDLSPPLFPGGASDLAGFIAESARSPVTPDTDVRWSSCRRWRTAKRRNGRCRKYRR